MALASHPDQTLLVEVGRLRPFSDIQGRHTVRLRDSRGPLRDIANRLEQAGCRIVRESEDWDDPTQFQAALPDQKDRPDAGPTNPDAGKEIDDLREDTRRWIQDRNQVVETEARQVTNELSSKGLLYSGAHRRAQAAVRERALQEYRDEITAKRRRYRELARSGGEDLPSFQLGTEETAVLSSWRGPLQVVGDDAVEIDDPTSSEREPEIRRFEQEGDDPKSVR